ncbi:MAG: peptidoglycan DD-metalloendopeptidase family protein [Bacteroidetes bacterium]|nr:peptidoglycan DD-metalloendopeptidase family protein [Bacteroidota bacterium]
MKIFAGATLLTFLSLCVVAAPAAGLGAKKKPYRSARHAGAARHKDHRLAGLIKTNIRHRPHASGRNSWTPAHPGTVITPAGLSDDFRRQKGHLAWPLEGTVAMSFGPHEYIKGVIHDNQGATIDCAEGAVARAVYAGEVTAVMNIGDVWCVILRHGRYYTAYSNLAKTMVVQGDQVQAGDSLGRVGDVDQLEFMLSDEEGRFYDPEVWLKR